MYKRIVSIALILVLLLSCCVISPKAYTSVEIAYGLGLLRGTGSGLDDEYLDSVPTRANASMIILRMLGLESDALEYAISPNFVDYRSAASFWHPVMAYLYDHPAVGFSGYTDGSFKPNLGIDANMLAKVLLTVLGYRQDIDFRWEGVMNFSESIGLKSLVGKSVITNSDVASAIVEALSLKVKGGASLITELVNDGVVDIDRAENYGFVIESYDIKIVSAKASGVRSVRVEFSSVIPKSAFVALRKDMVGVAHTYTLSSNRKVLDITTMAAMTAGSYMVVVGNKTMSFNVSNEQPKSLVIGVDKIYKDKRQDIGLGLLNQYGEQMSLSNVTISASNRTSASRKVVVSKSTQGVYLDASEANAGDQIYVYALDNDSLLSVSYTYTVQAVPAIKKISIKEVIGSSLAGRMFEFSQSHKIVLEMTDQYGQPYKLTQSDIDSRRIIISTGNSLVVSPSSVKADTSGNLVLSTGIAGETMLRVVVVSEGISAAVSIKVDRAPYLDSIKVEALPTTIFRNELIGVHVVGYDQYGNIYEIKSTDEIEFASSNQSVVFPGSMNISRGVLSFSTGNAGTANVDYKVNGKTARLLSIKVNDGTVPYIITGVDIPYKYFEQGYTGYPIQLGYINAVDQYGSHNSLSVRPYWDSVKWGIHIERVSGNSFSVNGTNISATGPAGTDVFNVFITRDGHIMDKSGYSFSLTSVASSDIKIAGIDTPESIYGGATGRKPLHNAVIGVKGHVATGAEVLLKTDSKGYPLMITDITVDNENIYVEKQTMQIRFNKYFEQDTVVGIKYWNNALQVGSDSIKVYSEAPKVALMEYDLHQNFYLSTSMTYTLPIQVLDQYGVDTVLNKKGSWISSNDIVVRDGLSFDTSTNRLSIKLKGTVMTDTSVVISFIASDGSFVFRGFFTVAAGTYE